MPLSCIVHTSMARMTSLAQGTSTHSEVVSKTLLLSSPRFPGVSSPHWNGMSFLKLSLIGSLPNCKNVSFSKTFRIKPKSLGQAGGPSQLGFLGAFFLGLIAHSSLFTLRTPATGRGFSSANARVPTHLCRDSIVPPFLADSYFSVWPTPIPPP